MTTTNFSVSSDGNNSIRYDGDVRIETDVHDTRTVYLSLGMKIIEVRHHTRYDGPDWTDDKVSIDVFTGSDFGTPGPVFITINGHDVPVSDPERFGLDFDKEWARRFVLGGTIID